MEAKENRWDRIKNTFKNEIQIREEKEKAELALKTRFANDIINNPKASWKYLKKKSAAIGYDLKDMRNESWSFMNHLYNLRNGIAHGKDTTILKSNSSDLKDEISKHYLKSLNYLNSKGIIDKNKLIENQNINDLLNKTTTDHIIQEALNLMNEIKSIYHNTFTANQFSHDSN